VKLKRALEGEATAVLLSHRKASAFMGGKLNLIPKEYKLLAGGRAQRTPPEYEQRNE